MKRIFYTLWLLLFCSAVYAQHIDSADLQAIDKTFAPKAIEDRRPGLSGMDEAPEFPGGTQALDLYIRKNTKYPKRAREDGIKGKVVLRYVVGRDGSIMDAMVVRGIGGGCDEEALRAIKAMPKWKPGKEKGQPVKVIYVLPVTFNPQD